MFIIIEGPFKENAHVLLQRAGYASHRAGAEISYTKRLSGERYPRFHVYPDIQGAHVRLNLHLDMKQNTYEGFARHQGEYEGKKVEDEMARLRAHFESQKGSAEKEQPKEEKKKLFGWF